MNLSPTEKRILVVAAHPDDEVIGCGATIAKWASKGAKIHILILGSGASSRYDISELNEPKVVAEVQNLVIEAKQAALVLGAVESEVIDRPCCRFDERSQLEITKDIEARIKVVQPHIIYTHWAEDVNTDHGMVFKGVMAATRPVWEHRPSRILLWENPSGTEWNTMSGFSPHWFTEIEDEHLQRKIDALSVYSGEVREFPHSRSPEYLTALARVRGAAAGVPLAEAFCLFRQVERE